MFNILSKYRSVLILIIFLVLDGLFFGLLNPNRVNQLLLLVSFLLVGVTCYFLFWNIFRYIALFSFTVKNKRSLALFISILIVLLLSLKSIGQFSLIDLISLSGFLIIIYVYFKNFKA